MIVPLSLENLFAGTAAHLALQQSTAPRALDVKLLQNRLQADGACLKPS